MKFFLDTAEIDKIRWAADLGIIEGVTTNPSLIAQTGRKFEDVIKKITTIIDGPISAEVVSMDAEGMIKEARKISSIHPNIVIKIPMIAEGLKAVRILEEEKIKTNVTLVFSVNQALFSAKAGATYISTFIGRIDDSGHDGMQLVRDVMTVLNNYHFSSELIVASIRHPLHVKYAAEAGAHIATVPPQVLEEMFVHSLTDVGLKTFLEDWKRVSLK